MKRATNVTTPAKASKNNVHEDCTAVCYCVFHVEPKRLRSRWDFDRIPGPQARTLLVSTIRIDTSRYRGFYGDRIPKSLRRMEMSATSETAILPISVTAFNGQVNLVFQIYSSSCSKSRCESLL